MSATTEPDSRPASEGCNRIPSSFVQTEVVTVGVGVRAGVGTGENTGVGRGGGIGGNVGVEVNIAVGRGVGVDSGVGVIPVSFSTLTITFAFSRPALNTILAMPFFLAVTVNFVSPFASVTSLFDDKYTRFLFLLILAVTLIPSGRVSFLQGGGGTS